MIRVNLVAGLKHLHVDRLRAGRVERVTRRRLPARRRVGTGEEIVLYVIGIDVLGVGDAALIVGAAGVGGAIAPVVDDVVAEIEAERRAVVRSWPGIAAAIVGVEIVVER